MKTSPVSRRAFLRRSAIAGAAVSLGWPLRGSWAAEGPDSPVRIVFCTDIHTRTEWGTPDALAMAARAINDRKADAVLCGGDVITDGFQTGEAALEPRWQAYLDGMHRAIAAPVETVLGNHDLVAAMPEDGSPALADPREPFRRHLGITDTYRTFEAAGYRVIILDSVEITGGDLKYRGFVPLAQIRWLESVLAGIDTDTPIILMTHMPLLTTFFQATDAPTASAPVNRIVVNNRQVLRLFETHRLALVLQGHLHVNEMIRWQGTTFITGGAVSGKWWRGAWHGTPEGFGVLTLRRERVDWEYVTYGWQSRRPPNA